MVVVVVLVVAAAVVVEASAGVGLTVVESWSETRRRDSEERKVGGEVLTRGLRCVALRC